MNIQKAALEAKRILGDSAEVEKVNGVCRVVRLPTADEKPEDFQGRVTREGKLVLGAGPSWLAALRHAARPIAAKRLDEEKAAKAEEQKALLEIQKDRESFYEFLRERFGAEYAAWMTPVTDAAAPSPEREPVKDITGCDI